MEGTKTFRRANDDERQPYPPQPFNLEANLIYGWGPGFTNPIPGTPRLDFVHIEVVMQYLTGRPPMTCILAKVRTKDGREGYTTFAAEDLAHDLCLKHLIEEGEASTSSETLTDLTKILRGSDSPSGWGQPEEPGLVGLRDELQELKNVIKTLAKDLGHEQPDPPTRGGW